MKKRSRKVSKHGRRRMQERGGITKGISEKMASRVYHHGIRKEDTTGELRTWIDGRNLRAGKTARIYGRMLFILHGQTVITTIRIPDSFVDDLGKYVEKEAYRRYTCYRKSLRQKHSGVQENHGGDRRAGEYHSRLTSPLRDLATIKVFLNRHLGDEAINATVSRVIKSYTFPFDYECTVSYEEEEDKRRAFFALRTISREYRLRLKIL